MTKLLPHSTGAPVRDPSKKGKTLEELEQEEGGTIKESQVPMAQVKRAQKRQGKAQTEGISTSHQETSCTCTFMGMGCS